MFLFSYSYNRFANSLFKNVLFSYVTASLHLEANLWIVKFLPSTHTFSKTIEIVNIDVKFARTFHFCMQNSNFLSKASSHIIIFFYNYPLFLFNLTPSFFVHIFYFSENPWIVVKLDVYTYTRTPLVVPSLPPQPPCTVRGGGRLSLRNVYALLFHQMVFFFSGLSFCFCFRYRLKNVWTLQRFWVTLQCFLSCVMFSLHFAQKFPISGNLRNPYSD